MRHFMCHNACEFVFVFGAQDQSAENADITAGSGKGVDLVILDDAEMKGVGLPAAGGGEALTEGLDVVVNQRVFDQNGLLAQGFVKALSHDQLFLSGDVAVNRFAHVGKFGVGVAPYCGA